MSITSKPITNLAPVSVFREGILQILDTDIFKLGFIHLDSGVYQEQISSKSFKTNKTQITGYTEWLSTMTPTITLSWDWMLCPYSRPQLQKTGAFYSNLRLLEKNGKPLSEKHTERTLDELINRIEWSQKVDQFITQKYG